MIAYLDGEVVEVTPEGAVVSVQGVGYDVALTSEVVSGLHVGRSARLWIYTAVREDAIQLFGFSQKEEKSLFLSLISVNGVGPKVAMKVLSGASTRKILELIESSDVKGLSQLPKIGKKTAEQIVLTLRGKLPQVEVKSATAGGEVRGQILYALTNLGFKESVVSRVVAALPESISVEEGVRRGLASLAAN